MRDETVSICKAFGIILMVMIHAGIPGDTFVSMFHMPLFFVMSGFCFKDKYLQYEIAGNVSNNYPYGFLVFALCLCWCINTYPFY